MGALSYTLAGTDALRLIAELTPAETGNDEALLQRLAPFLLAGLQSPVPSPDRTLPERTRICSRLASMLTLLWIAAVLVAVLALAYVNASGAAFTAAIAVALVVAWFAHTIPGWVALAADRRRSCCSRFRRTCRCCGASS